MIRRGLGSTLGLLAHELKHGYGSALAGRGEIEDAREQVAFRADCVVDRLHGDAGLGGDPADRGGVVAVLEKQPRRGVDNHALRLLCRQLLPRLDGLHDLRIAF